MLPLLPGKLRWSGRRQVAARYPKVGLLLPPDPWKNHNIACDLPRRDNDVVRSGRYIFEMEIIWAKFSSLDPWETCVVVQPYFTPLRMLMVCISCSGSREELCFGTLTSQIPGSRIYGVGQFHDYTRYRCHEELWARVSSVPLS